MQTSSLTGDVLLSLTLLTQIIFALLASVNLVITYRHLLHTWQSITDVQLTF